MLSQTLRPEEKSAVEAELARRYRETNPIKERRAPASDELSASQKFSPAKEPQGSRRQDGGSSLGFPRLWNRSVPEDSNQSKPSRWQIRKNKKDLIQPVINAVSQLPELTGELAEALKAMAERRPPRIEELTMADAVSFFVENRGSIPEAEAGVILRDKTDSDTGEYSVHLFFLDSDGRPLIGRHRPARTYLTQRFDAELADTFRTNNVVIFN